MKTNLLLLLASVALLSGCTLAPEYNRPETPIPKEWPSGPAYQAAPPADTALAADLLWREFFTDERLQKVIATALNNNRDFRVAALNVERARALYGIQKTELFPTIDATGYGSKQRTALGLPNLSKPTITERYGVNLGISAWEIDLFGRLRSLKDKALEEYLATEQARRGAQIMLIAGVAQAYLSLAADQENLKLAHATLEAQQASFSLIGRRYEVGLVTELALRQAQTRVEAARVDVALYTQRVAVSENALNLLAGAPLADELMPTDLNTVSPNQGVSAGLSSEVLLRRPDLLQAENLLRAANANIGAARAAFFPRIALTTSIGTASNQLSGLFKSGSDAWDFAPQAVLPIFDTRVWFAADAVKIEREIALAQYEKAVQTAFREVADALAVRGTVNDQLSAQQALVAAVAETYRLANARYAKGVDNFLTVLDAQRSLYSAQQGLIAMRLAELANQVQLYAVLGDGADQDQQQKQE